MNINRRTALKGIAGISLALPYLEVMGGEKGAEAEKNVNRFCALYTANGMSLPLAKHNIPEWHWFPHKTGKDFKFNKSTKPLEKHRKNLTFIGGFHHPSGPKSDPHTCSDMWLTGAPLYNPKPGTYNTVSVDQVIASKTKQYCRMPSLVLSIDAGAGFLSRTGTISYNVEGKPVPAENNPRNIFNRLFLGNKENLKKQRALLKKKMKVVDAVLESSKALNKKLGKSDREKMDQYLTTLNELDERIKASEKWIDIPLKKQDFKHLNFNFTAEEKPAQFYKTMFDLIALAFDADITRTVAFMMNREDGMGISDNFPFKIGLHSAHHSLSHAKDKKGQYEFAKYDEFLSVQINYFLDRMQSYKCKKGSVLDNTIVLFGSGASTTHNSTNLPTLIAGGKNMGIKHGTYYRKEKERMSNLYLSIMQSMGLKDKSFSDSTKRIEAGIFTYKQS